MRSKEYLPVSANSQGGSSHELDSSKIFLKTPGLIRSIASYSVLVCCVLLLILGVVSRLASTNTESENYTKLNKDLLKTAADLENLNKILNDIRKENKNLKNMIETFQKSANQPQNIYDTSTVGVTVFENMENFYKRNQKHPWVSPCGWNDCRYIHFNKALEHIVNLGKADLKKKLDVLQIGFCSTALEQLLKMSDSSLETLNVADTFSNGSPSSFRECRGRKRGKPRSAKELTEEKAQLEKNEKVKIYSVYEISKIEPESVDLVFVDSYGVKDADQLKQLVETAFKVLKVDGFIFGHSYGIRTPLQLRDNKKRGLQVSLSDSVSVEISWDNMKLHKKVVDDFIISANEEKKGTSGVISVAGETSWYIQKRKITFKDLFSDGTRL